MIRFCSLFSGSSGNSIFLRAGDTRVLVDAGVSARRIAAALASIGEEGQDLDAILVTHEHSDHTQGIGVASRRFGVPVWANERTWRGIDPRHNGLEPERVRTFVTGEPFYIGGIAVRPFAIPHDASDPVGFAFEAGGRKVTLATDIGHITQELLDHFTGSDAILIESNHDVGMLRDGSYPEHLKRRILSKRGHLSNDVCGQVVGYLAERGTRRFMLGHMSAENNDPGLAYEAACGALMKCDLRPGEDVTVVLALRDEVGQVFEL